MPDRDLFQSRSDANRNRQTHPRMPSAPLGSSGPAGAFPLSERIPDMDKSNEKCARLATMRICQSTHSPLPFGFGFSATRILDACQTATDTHQVKWRDLEVFIYTKSYAGYIDVIGVGVGADAWYVMFALQAFSDLCAIPLEELAPLQIVEHIAERFGLTITAGGKSAKFFLEHEFAIPRDIGAVMAKGGLFVIENLDDHPYTLSNAVARTATTISVAMAFCIDLARYGDWVKNR